METLRKPTFKILYNGKNITEDLTNEILGLSYTDKIKGESDDISFVVDDSKGLWRNQWRPEKGDIIQVWMGYENQLFPAGIFEVDEIQIAGPPDKVEIRAAAANLKKSIRTKRSYGHENKTLKQIVQKIATDHGLEIVGTINSSFLIKRITQYRETDLSFLERLAKQYGYIFSIRDEQLIFTSIYDLESSSSSFEIHRTDLNSYSITDKTVDSNQDSANIKFFNPRKGEVIESKDNTDWGLFYASGVDSIEEYKNVDNVTQADEITKASLHDKKTHQVIVNFKIEGDPRILSGVNFELGGLGQYSGKYNILDSNHSISPSGGYITTGKAKKIGSIDKTKWL